MECCSCFQNDKNKNLRKNTKRANRPKSQWIQDNIRGSDQIKDVSNILAHTSYISPRNDNNSQFHIATSSYDGEKSWIQVEYPYDAPLSPKFIQDSPQRKQRKQVSQKIQQNIKSPQMLKNQYHISADIINSPHFLLKQVKSVDISVITQLQTADGEKYLDYLFKERISNKPLYIKILLLEMKMLMSQMDLNLMNLQSLFNNLEILSTNFLVGSSKYMQQFDVTINNESNMNLMESELDNSHILPRFTPPISNNQHLNTLEALHSDQNTVIQHNNHLQASQNIKELSYGMESNRNLKGENQCQTTQEQSSSRPQTVILKHKLEKLKGFSLYAQMLLVGEPIKKAQTALKHPQNQTTHLDTEDRTSFNNTTANNFTALQTGGYPSNLNQPTYNNNISNLFTNSGNYPDQNQTVSMGHRYVSADEVAKIDKQECLKMNSEMMKAMIERKMRKNRSYYELRVLNEDGSDSLPPRTPLQLGQYNQER
ncbi:UNKNOWN [Stylonychia lemnae]|uniref:Uncharacterized protein n=1 Tax=Stylonychia lemnae TaxID=5949 RepID=A0A078B561_STYLE|nr:UNKNOWN [Stylonychia lemnae]|eukprot:CDW89564.1 UNKNOWN [Stylonychia lemnae]